jgi:hypothetical protein
MSATKTIDISKLSEAQQNLFKSLFEQFCERSEPKEEKKSKPKVWKPEYGDWYWYISSDGQVDNCEWVNGPIDYGRYSMGNCFRTKEEAGIAREKQKIKTELQRFADEHNDPDQEEWDGENEHYRIGYDIDADDFITTSVWSVIRDDIYFTSKEIAEDAANKVGVKRIMKYLFDADCEVDE